MCASYRVGDTYSIMSETRPTAEQYTRLVTLIHHAGSAFGRCQPVPSCPFYFGFDAASIRLGLPLHAASICWGCICRGPTTVCAAHHLPLDIPTRTKCTFAVSYLIRFSYPFVFALLLARFSRDGCFACFWLAATLKQKAQQVVERRQLVKVYRYY